MFILNWYLRDNGCTFVSCLLPPDLLVESKIENIINMWEKILFLIIEICAHMSD